MDNFEETYIIIENKKIPCLIEGDTKWYPMNYFFKKILYRNCDIQSYRDSNIIKYMKVINYNFSEQKGNVKIKTWFINEKGIKYILKYITTNSKKNYIKQMREQGIFEACQFFKVERKVDINNKYTKIMNDFKNYNKEEKYIFELNNSYNEGILWKRCECCNKFYPNTKNYYDINSKNNLKNKCKKCFGNNFSLINKKQNIMLKKCGFCLINLLKEKKYTEALDIINNNNLHLAPDDFYNKDVLIKLINYIKKNKNGNGINYNLRYMSKFINIPPFKIKEIIGKDIKKNKIIQKKDYNKIKINEFKKICKENLDNIICPKYTDKIDSNIILSFINKNGLNLISKKEISVKYAKVYIYNDSRKKMINLIKKIKGGN